jgi:hypothetical protein
MSSTVVAACDGPKALLASSIPLNEEWRNIRDEASKWYITTAFTLNTYDLQFYRLPILLNSADFLASPRQGKKVMGMQ